MDDILYLNDDIHIPDTIRVTDAFRVGENPRRVMITVTEEGEGSQTVFLGEDDVKKLRKWLKQWLKGEHILQRGE